jgi:hypothetical protein
MSRVPRSLRSAVSAAVVGGRFVSIWPRTPLGTAAGAVAGWHAVVVDHPVHRVGGGVGAQAWVRADLTIKGTVVHERLVAEHGFTGHYQRIKMFLAEADENRSSSA